MNNDQVSAGIAFLVGIAILLGSIPYNVGSLATPGPGFFPFSLGMLTILLSAVGFVDATLKRKSGNKWSNPFARRSWVNPLIVTVAVLVYGALLVPLGFLLCTALFVAFLLRLGYPQHFYWVLGGALATSVISYFIFDILLKAQLPKGIFGI